jgi:hypothetical protein
MIEPGTEQATDLAEIAVTDPAARPTTTVGEVDRPAPTELVVDVDTPLGQVLRRLPGSGRGIVVIRHDGRVAGRVAVTDLRCVAGPEALRSGSARHRVPWNGSIGWE